MELIFIVSILRWIRIRKIVLLQILFCRYPENGNRYMFKICCHSMYISQKSCFSFKTKIIRWRAVAIFMAYARKWIFYHSSASKFFHKKRHSSEFFTNFFTNFFKNCDIFCEKNSIHVWSRIDYVKGRALGVASNAVYGLGALLRCSQMPLL